MDAAWIAVVGSSVAAVGSAAAVTITAWSARLQAKRQNAVQESQWRREKRRDSYAAFLESSARARDELSVILDLARADQPDAIHLAEQIKAARALTDVVRSNGAKILVEGPDGLVRSTRVVEEDLVVFRRLLETIITALQAGAAEVDLGGVGGAVGKLGMAEAQEAAAGLREGVRARIDQFSDAARRALGSSGEAVSTRVSTPPSDADLQWLLARLRDLDIDTTAVDVSRPITEIDGVTSLELAVLFSQARDSYSIEDRWTLADFASASVAQTATYLAAHRS